MTIKQKIDYFPLSVAADKAFCNRVEEIIQLENHITKQRPVLLISPRRYGKTSLVLKAVKNTKQPYSHIDLFSAVDEHDVERAILNGVGSIITKVETIPQKALALANKIFSGTHIQASISNVKLSIEVKKRDTKPAYHILDILEKLEKLAEKSRKKIILFFDEFQCIVDATPDKAIEAVLRQVAQLTKSISFIFSGSNRRLLNQLFNDRNQPFYKLCEKITLERISETAYEKHLQSLANKFWGQKLSEKIIETIFLCTQRHPYYMNLLCSRIYNTSLPTVETVLETWEKYTIEEKSSVAAELDLLSKNQKKLLIIIARTGGTTELLGKIFVQKSNISKTTISQALQVLENLDYLYQNEDGKFVVLDPLIQSVLNDHSG